jgi:hypothetical protein
MTARSPVTRLAALLLVGAATGAAFAAGAVELRQTPGPKPELLVVQVTLLGRTVAETVAHSDDAAGWTRWGAPARALVGGLLGLTAGLAAGRRASAGLSFPTFRALEGMRGALLGALVGLVVCASGFALLGAIITAMLNEPGWTLARGARMGAAFGGLLGLLGGAVLGAATTLPAAEKTYQALRTRP